MRVREKNDLLHWFKFFLVGIIETAKSGITTFDNILKLKKQVDENIQSLGSRAANAQKVVLYLYQNPVIDAAKVGEIADISPASAYKLVADLERLEILHEVTGGKRGKMYLFSQYIHLFKS
jgi:Fic family protein